MESLTFTLDDERSQELERLSALGYTHEEMAVYFDVDKRVFLQLALDVESEVYYRIQRGKLMSAAKEQLKLLEAAEGGNISAGERLSDIRRNRGWETSKLDIFGAFEDKRLIERLQDYLEGGSVNKLSAEEAIYIDALTLFNSLGRKLGRRNTVAFFTKAPFSLSYSRASEMYDEAINLFYRDRGVEKKAMRHLFADELQEAARIVKDNAITARDWEVFGDLKMKAAKLLELDREDPPKLPADAYQKPVRVYSLEIESLGLPSINRQLVASQIEELDIPERDKIRLKQDSRLLPINLEEKLHELEEESKGEQ
ncbi:hypothetical protein C943_03296 [Mariniradius saccharolyticus AK6]|uniref:Uncharacterized protein n=1 Tax=Mariniradius saccharolyticus AK6 TaxID=1239962 RepID=M7XIE7_9BACT|nr:hypothetical protein [Mariniradius saccharolyticus]EMS34609.1 hypothetical protein C943_03296 [Mariniradius saccharolyticus AK6]